MNTMEQGKHDTGLDVQVNLPTSGNPIADTMARIVEGPYHSKANEKLKETAKIMAISH